MGQEAGSMPHVRRLFSWDNTATFHFFRLSMTSRITPEGSAPLSLGQSIQQAIAHHQAGRLREAEQLYRAALQLQPGHPVVNHNLGVIAGQLGQPGTGLPFLKAALDADPSQTQFWLSYANALLLLGRTTDASQIVDAALARGLDSPALQSLKRDAAGAGLVKREPVPAAKFGRLMELFNTGRHAELEAEARALLEQHPDSGFAWKVLGAALQLQSKDGLHALQKATQLLPDDADAHNNLGNALQGKGQFESAAASYRRALQLKPDYAEAHANLGNALHGLGQLDAAVASYEHALTIKPDYAKTHNNLGSALYDLGQLNDAIASYRRAVQLNPDYAEAHNNLGNALRDNGQLEAALASGRHAVQLRPDYAEAHSNLGNALQALGQVESAIGSYRRAIELDPDLAVAHGNLGSALQELGQLDEAVSSYRRALTLNPDNARTHNNLGSALHDLGQLDLAASSYSRALELQPALAGAHTNRAHLQQDLGQLDEAAASYRCAMELQPGALEHAIHHHLLLPIVSESLTEMAAWRNRYLTGINALRDTSGLLENPGETANPSSFFLAYHNQDDRPAMEARCRRFRASIPSLTAVAPHLSNWQPPAVRGDRIRVGFLSEFFCEHTIGKLYQGFIQHLDRTRFEVILIRPARARRDEFSRHLDALADKVVNLPPTLPAQQQAVMAEKLDVLFYPDIGMAPSTYFLAFARLAPVQAVSWGHPDTSGLDTMDYFVSARSIEPDNAAEHYTERLIRLGRLPCYYPLPQAGTSARPRKALGLPESGTLYGCPQTLFKFHPDFDAVLAEIAEGDPTGHVVLLEGPRAAWADLLRARWAKSFPILLERVRFLPRMSRQDFLCMISHMDVLLDPLHFGSGNTLYEAMVYGTPIVTWPGQFARGRVVAGAYRQMGVSDAPVVSRMEDYAPLALALGRDPERRDALRDASQTAASQELFADMAAVRDFESFLDAAVAATGRREKLAADWAPAAS